MMLGGWEVGKKRLRGSTKCRDETSVEEKQQEREGRRAVVADKHGGSSER